VHGRGRHETARGMARAATWGGPYEVWVRRAGVRGGGKGGQTRRSAPTRNGANGGGRGGGEGGRDESRPYRIDAFPDAEAPAPMEAISPLSQQFGRGGPGG
jgi:hypothetical protein